MTAADPDPVAALRAESDLSAALVRARQSLEAAEETLAMYEERTVLEARVTSYRTEVARLEHQHAELRRQIWGAA